MMFNARKVGLSILVGLLLIVLTISVFIPARTVHAASSVTINGATKYQTMDGFGFSDAFGPADTLRTLSSASEQKQILDMLLSTSTGAGFTILRNLFPSDASHTIEPNSPASPTAAPQYVWDGSSWGQVWLAQQAQLYGVTQFYGDAWSAPGFMKTNGSEINGGTLCGSPSATCSSGDWRQAYANYLVQYIKDYQSAGIPLTHVGYVNEPNLTTSYSSMLMNPAQTADFAKVLGPTLKTAGLSTQVVCCEPEGWDLAQSYASAISSDATANANVNVISSHGYTAPPNSALTGTGSKHIWQTEWSKFDTWDPSWDSGSDASGFTWAQYVYTGITASNLSAFLYWWGVGFNSTDNGILIRDNGGTVEASKRLWALANYSRFVRPGATRVSATTTDSNLQLTAYMNTDGTTSIVALNNAYSDIPATFALQNTGITQGGAVPYLTNAASSTAAQAALPATGGAFSATVPARSLVTYKVTAGVVPTPPPSPTPTPSPTAQPGSGCQIHYTVSNQWSTGFTASVVMKNTGLTAINGWTLNFVFPSSQQVSQGWNGAFSQQGSRVSISNLSYNGAIPAGGTLGSSPGFNGTWSGSNASPTAFTLNGISCSVV